MNKLHLLRYKKTIYLFFTFALFVSIVFISNNVSNVRDPRPQAATKVYSITSNADQAGAWGAHFIYPPDSPNTTPGGGPTSNPRVDRSKPNSDYTIYNTMLRWDTSSIPDDATITSAVLRVRVGSKSNHNSRNITAEWYSSWPITSADYSTIAAGGAIDGFPLSSLGPDGEDDDIGFSSLSGISKTGYTGIRIHISGGQPSGNNNFSFSNPRLIVIYSTPEPPLQPPTVSLSASATSVSYGGSTTLTWTVGEGTPSNCSASGGWSGNKSVSGGSETISNLTSDTTFTISCSNSAGSDSDSVAVIVGAAPDTTNPTTPGNLKVTSKTTSSISLAWNASTDSGGSGLAGYKVYRGGSHIKTTTSTSYTNSGLSSGTAYSYYVRAYDGAGNHSGNSNTVNVTTSSPDPELPPDGGGGGTPQPPPPVPPPPGGGLPSLPSASPSIPGVAIPIDPDIVNILKIKLSVSFLLGNIKSPLIVGGFVQDLELKPGVSDYEVDVRGAKFALGKTLNIQIGGNKALIKKLKLKTKAPKQPVKFDTLYLGDTNRDNKINDKDFQRYLDSIPTQDESSDVNADGVVNSLDWAILLVNFGKNGSR